MAPRCPVLCAVGPFKTVNQGQVDILMKDLALRKLSVIDVASSLTMTVVGPFVAWAGFGAGEGSRISPRPSTAGCGSG